MTNYSADGSKALGLLGFAVIPWYINVYRCYEYLTFITLWGKNMMGAIGFDELEPMEA